jgi:hypothetical protein
MGLGSGILDPGFGKNLFLVPGPGSRGQKGTGSRIRIRNTVKNFSSGPDPNGIYNSAINLWGVWYGYRKSAIGTGTKTLTKKLPMTSMQLYAYGNIILYKKNTWRSFWSWP